MSFTKESPLVLVGAGKMGGALLAGWIANGVHPDAVVVVDPGPSSEMLAFLDEKGIRWEATTQGVPVAQALIVAVKPQLMEKVLPAIVTLVAQSTVVLSMAAGTSVETFHRHLGQETVVVRCMPNTPAQVGRGITGGYASGAISQKQQDMVNELLQAVGEFVWVDSEEQIDFVTAVSGSGPAYLFHMTECLAEAGKALGLSAEVAEKLARHTVSGAGELLHQSPESASRLRENVTSPGGTTAAALHVLMDEKRLQTLMEQAVAAAAQRAKELA
ncbi:pyrroline-5-carboxylate reductase [Flexibacterium corallicola]|uniref:pyrroline-5-carboxylate reductase n=1 Tax=Flexibacterium corallicola TaxID=3037259 RepID=UPI00286EF96C|nr:pyrroline-5-carboxylate reductase [Pseudovibrio sp. M1P-2-3]